MSKRSSINPSLISCSLLAGSKISGYSDNYGKYATFGKISQICLSNDGANLYVTDTINKNIRVIDIKTMKVSTYVASKILKKPEGLCVLPDNRLVIADSELGCIFTYEPLKGLLQLVGKFPDLNQDTHFEVDEEKQPGSTRDVETLVDDFGEYARFGNALNCIGAFTNSAVDNIKPILLVTDSQNSVIRQIDPEMQLVSTVIDKESFSNPPTHFSIDSHLSLHLVCGGEIFSYDRLSQYVGPYENRKYTEYNSKNIICLTRDNTGSIYATCDDGSIKLFLRDSFYTLIAPGQNFEESRTILSTVSSYIFPFYSKDQSPQEVGSLKSNIDSSYLRIPLDHPASICFDFVSALNGSPRLFVATSREIYILNLDNSWYVHAREQERLHIAELQTKQLARLAILAADLNSTTKEKKDLEFEYNDLKMANQKLNAKIQMMEKQKSVEHHESRTSMHSCTIL